MTKTGERYTAARHQLLAKAPSGPPETPEPPAAPEPPTPTVSSPTSEPSLATPFRGERTSSDEALVARTGRTWDEWFALLDAWGAADRPHPEIARWLSSEQGVDGWWAQEVTVGYEMAIGRRQPGQRPDGYAASASKTVGVSVERLFEAFVDDELRGRWLPGATLRLRTATPPRTARFDWEDGSTRLAIGFTAKGDARSTVALEHSRLPDAEAAERQRAFWREHLHELQRVLEE
jgi:uncharacterized protein YndB with AHSA1/START domain